MGIRKLINNLLLSSLLLSKAYAQQLPYYTQFMSNEFLQNPAVAGTKRPIDARLNYRMQWVGFSGAPRTQSFSLNSRFYKGKMGAGIYVMNDQIGPSKQLNLGASYAYHIRFPDCELSAGVAANFTDYTLDGNYITLHNTQDPSINQYITNSRWVADANTGIYLYNDRFHIGISAMHIVQSTVHFYKKDSLKHGKVQYVPQLNFTVGYNFAQNPDYIWESTLYVYYISSVPFMLNYTMRLHIKEKFITGISLRLHDAVALQFGITFLENFQACYSYDILISRMRTYSGGSHEIMLIYSLKPNKKRRAFIDTHFLHQKYGYMF